MFSKAYKPKSTNTLKNSEKKHLVQRIRYEFPSTSEEKVKELVPVKSNSTCTKLVLHNEETCNVYVVENVPIMIELEERLLPTVYALWKIPDLIPSLTIHSLVLSKIQGGAPLYLPGVVPPAAGAAAVFARGAPLACRTADNAAAAIVGRAAISSGDMLFRKGGVCLETIHVYGDLLCKDPKFAKIERPKFEHSCSHEDINDVVHEIEQLSVQTSRREEWPSLSRSNGPAAAAVIEPEPAPAPAPAPAPVPNAPRLIPEPDRPPDMDPVALDDTADTARPTTGEAEHAIPTTMDALLRWSLLTFLKKDGARVELPLATNLLYKNHMMQHCPEDRTLDVKKSSYKKMSKFLEAMQAEGLVEVREVAPGVDAVVALACAHAVVRAHRAPRGPPAGSTPPGGLAPPAGAYVPPRITDLYSVTAAVAPLLALKKGTTLSAADVRKTLTEYVKSRNLHSEHKGAVTLDAALAQAAGKRAQEVLKWDELMAGVLGKMTASTELRFADGSARLVRARLEPVRMALDTRSGNKKVTLVSNLESFGVNMSEVSRACQLGAAAASAVRGHQLMVQGDQTHFIAKLLIEKYGLPKKYLEGADKALNKKNK